MAVPFPSSKLVKGCTAGFASARCHGLFPIKTSVECRKAGTASKQHEQKWWFITFPYKGNQRSWQIDAGLQERHRTGERSGKELPYYPVMPLRSCDRTALIHSDQLGPKQRPHDIHKDCFPHSSECRICPSHGEVLFPLFATHGTLKPTWAWKWHYWFKQHYLPQVVLWD